LDSASAIIDAAVSGIPGSLIHTPQSSKTALPSDFVGFLVGAIPIPDANFIGAKIGPGDLHGEFRLESEAVSLAASTE
jgi:hypothetical protein